MPLYEFKCRGCEAVFEDLIRNAADEQAVACPACGSREAHRLVSAPAATTSDATGAPPAGGCVPRGGFS